MLQWRQLLGSGWPSKEEVCLLMFPRNSVHSYSLISHTDVYLSSFVITRQHIYICSQHYIRYDGQLLARQCHEKFQPFWHGRKPPDTVSHNCVKLYPESARPSQLERLVLFTAEMSLRAGMLEVLLGNLPNPPGHFGNTRARCCRVVGLTILRNPGRLAGVDSRVHSWTCHTASRNTESWVAISQLHGGCVRWNVIWNGCFVQL